MMNGHAGSSRNSSRAASPSYSRVNSKVIMGRTHSGLINKHRLQQSPRMMGNNRRHGTVRGMASMENRHLSQLKLLQQFQQQIKSKPNQQPIEEFSNQPLFINSERHPDHNRFGSGNFSSSTPMMMSGQNRQPSSNGVNKCHIVQKSGHFQVSHPMFKTCSSSKFGDQFGASSSTPTNRMPPGLLSKGQHQQMSRIIHKQLQAFYDVLQEEKKLHKVLRRMSQEQNRTNQD